MEQREKELAVAIRKLFSSMESTYAKAASTAGKRIGSSIVKSSLEVDFSEDLYAFSRYFSDVVTQDVSETVSKASLRSRELARDFAEHISGALISRVSRTQRNTIQSVIARSIDQNLSIKEMTSEIKRSIGLLPQQERALRRLRGHLGEQGKTGRAIEMALRAKREQMLIARAKTIASTELQTAKNIGQFEDWVLRLDEGKYEPSVKKRWIAGDACPVCIKLSQKEPIPLKDVFEEVQKAFLHPPAHPNCKCKIKLVKE